jgi:hypothetical protein
MSQLSIVIPLKKDSSHGDIELQYCLRSVQRHVYNLKNVVIVSDYLSAWLNPSSVVHIRKTDGLSKQENLKAKILAACDDERVSDPFLFTNDDIFLTANIGLDFPYYYSGCLSDVREKGSDPLRKQLKALGRTDKWFDSHFPILYYKEGFKEAMAAFAPDVIIKSAYCNYHTIDGEQMKDLKINSRLTKERITEEINGRPCFSIGDYGITKAMREVWQELYPNKSIYEL